MARQLVPAFAYTVVYVKDVARSVAFYSDAFGYKVRRLDGSHRSDSSSAASCAATFDSYVVILTVSLMVSRWGELESGQTTIAFTPLHQRETDERTGAVRTPAREGERGPVEVCFDYTDVDAAYKRAVDHGAVPVSPPEVKEWGQKVGYVRDMDGIVVRMGSHVGDGTPHV
ncbi:hypothetical protein C4D60_Mb10t27710 [Musa balbisiana]|uniref:VOC domain-containing protein n=1 Tax=Musa balbisiana TaxID=52838 RepID=A0A4S8J2R4_MUSBA|nr:hypothetical protein C4D60_Mb10t27710 [Musa balbisiana]